MPVPWDAPVRRTSTKQRKNPGTNNYLFDPSFNSGTVNKSKRLRKKCQQPECLINFKFSSAMGTEQNKTG